MFDINFLFYIIVFIYGAVFGSFFNVIIFRIPAGMSIVKGRSVCFNCKNTIKPYDLIPLLSYIFLGARCRYCKSKISIRYFIVELLTGISFVLAFAKYNLSKEFFLICLFYSMLIIVGFIDYDTMYIYDSILIYFSLAFLIILFLINGINIKQNILGAICGFSIYYLIYFVSKLIYKKEAFGFGDVLLNSSIGLVLGKNLIVFSSFLSFFVGLFIIILLFILGRKFKVKDEIPFGPYMCISAFITSLYGQKIIYWYLNSFIY